MTMASGRDVERTGTSRCAAVREPQDSVCYNYGIGDFQHAGKMAWGFFRGTNSFWVGRQDPRDMLRVYHWADRSIWIQPLPLTKDEVAKVIDKLEYDVQEEHKYYAYDHFWDNCTTASAASSTTPRMLDHAHAAKQPSAGRTIATWHATGSTACACPC